MRATRLIRVFVVLAAASTISVRSVASSAECSPRGCDSFSVRAIPVAGASGGRFAKSALRDMVEYQREHVFEPLLAIPRTAGPPPQCVDENGKPVVPSERTYEGVMVSTWEHPGLPPAPTSPPSVAGSISAPDPKITFTGVLDDASRNPPDTHGAVGRTHLVEVLNSGVTVFTRSGAVEAPQVSLQVFFSALGTDAGSPASRVFDPKVLYDQYADRWVIVAGGNPNQFDGTTNSWLLIAVSQTQDATAEWKLFAVPGNRDAVPVHATDWPDFPGLGVDPNNVVVTANMFALGGVPFLHADVWVFDKARLLQAESPLEEGVDYARTHNPGAERGFTLQPCHTFDQTSDAAVNYLLDSFWFDQATGLKRFIRIKRITGIGAAAAVDALGGDNWLEVNAYNFCLAEAPQAGCATFIETNDTRLLNAVWRNGKIWTTHQVGVPALPAGTCGSVVSFSRSQIGWYELDPAASGPFPGGAPIQQGHIADLLLHFFYPSIAVNRRECAAVGFSGSSFVGFVGAYFTLRESLDPVSAMRPVRLLTAGREPYHDLDPIGRNRWGDYSATVVDPADDTTFWTVQTYAEEQLKPSTPGACAPEHGRWGTVWAAFGCAAVAGDCNGDGLVDLIDYQRFAECINGPASAPSDECECADLTEDGKIDMLDFALFQTHFLAR